MVDTRPLIVAAPDSYKGSCSAVDAAKAMLTGARSVFGDGARYLALPLADGGEGTLDALLGAWGQVPARVDATDALGRSRAARFGISEDGRIAIIEAAEANGLPWVSDRDLRPLDADSFGVGTIGRAALDAGVTEVLLCIGGSATSDGGTGMLRALGAQFLDAQGEPIAPGARGLQHIDRVDVSRLDSRVHEVRWRIAVDVENPLTGPRGAAHVFGPQKGAGPDEIAAIDAGLEHLARVLAAAQGIPADEYLARPGYGAAGGLALACSALLEAELVSGADMVADALDAREHLGSATIILTGEGRLDEQSLGGKVIDLVRRHAPATTPIVVIAGAVELDAAACREAGITAALSIATGPARLDELQERVTEHIADTTAHACSLISVNHLPTPA